jgi:callose synthase
MCCENRKSLEDENKSEELRSWASYRGQTLGRTGSVFVLFSKLDFYVILRHFVIIAIIFVTVRGTMYYREALKLQAFLDMAEDEGL